MQGGGPLTRELQVSFLKRFFNVEVITIEYTKKAKSINNGIHYLPIGLPLIICYILERSGIVTDYLFYWSRLAISYLKNKIKDGDIIFTTTGGEMGCIKIGAFLKKYNSKIKHIANYHDVLDFAEYDKDKVYYKFHRNIDKIEGEYLKNTDYVFTNSVIMKNLLLNKFNFLSNKVDYMYFGFNGPIIRKMPSKTTGQCNNKIKIGYIGEMGFLQAPEILIHAWNTLTPTYKSKIELTFIGNYMVNEVIANTEGINRIRYLQREELIAYLSRETDIAFLSIINKPIFKTLMSTKFYEYIGIGIPIISALPNGCEAGQVISEEGFGWVCIYGDITALTKILIYAVEHPEAIKECEENIKKQRNKYNSEQTLSKMVNIIMSLLNK